MQNTNLSHEFVRQVGRAFVAQFGLSNIAVGRDMRSSGQDLLNALVEGASEQGADVTEIGLVSTDALYFAVGKFGFDGGVMVTASHNPANYNGLKFCRKDAMAVSLDTGLGQMRDRIISGDLPSGVLRGNIVQRDIIADFAEHCLSFVERKSIERWWPQRPRAMPERLFFPTSEGWASDVQAASEPGRSHITAPRAVGAGALGLWLQTRRPEF